MTVQERIYSLQLLEKMKNNPEFAKRLGLEIVEKSNRKGAGKHDDQYKHNQQN